MLAEVSEGDIGRLRGAAYVQPIKRLGFRSVVTNQRGIVLQSQSSQFPSLAEL